MSGKLDQSLDDIVKTRRQTARRPGRGRGGASGARTTTSTAPPAGGVSKSARNVKQSTKAVRPLAPSGGTAESKIIVSGLPSDVSEPQIKDYFAKTIGPVKKVFLTYGPNGQSRGIATIVFTKSDSAVEAATQLNGVKVDNRAMKIEVIVGADQAPVPTPPKALGERIAQPKGGAKAQPKSATATTTNGVKSGRGRGQARTRGGRGGRNGRGKPKTADELDAEMMDYFDASATGAAGGDSSNAAPAANESVAPAAANGGDTGMDDEIM